MQRRAAKSLECFEPRLANDPFVKGFVDPLIEHESAANSEGFAGASRILDADFDLRNIATLDVSWQNCRSSAALNCRTMGPSFASARPNTFVCQLVTSVTRSRTK